MAQIILDSPGVDAFGGQVMAAGMAKHVGVDASMRQHLLAQALDHSAEAH